jgi:hypothetical protein
VLALAAGAKSSGETLVLPVKLVVRESTGPPRTQRGRDRRAGFHDAVTAVATEPER